MIAQLLVAHLIGDFLLQNHWMQSKSHDSFVCTAHVACYAVPFVALSVAGILPLWALLAILSQHWAQDRFALHLKWMALYRQTPSDKWPVGPLCMDQSWHIAFIGAIALFC